MADRKTADRRPPLGIYIHVPFCAARCGYCDFNTYVPRSDGQQIDFVEAAMIELNSAREELGDRQAQTVFVGGGTPTLLGAEALLRLLEGVVESFGLMPDAEVSTEANPESVSPEMLARLKQAGFTRISLGMQSASPHVLKALDRVHTPGAAVAAAMQAREAGFEHVSLDLIYGTPGESDCDWEQSLEMALSAQPDHISAYALTVESGTALAAAIGRGALPAPDEGEQARRFLIADERLEAAGFEWYELCNWASSEAGRCAHNIGYWRSYDWWGVGPGAHSHVGGVRWWNVRAPSEYAKRLKSGRSPAAGREILSEQEKAIEAVMLGIRTSDGLELSALSKQAARVAREHAGRGWATIADDRLTLTRKGRLLADAVARDLSV